MTATSVRIYVASLAHYNAGRLYGEWVDIEGMDADDILEAIAGVIDRAPVLPDVGPAEEWAIHDYEGFGAFKLSENPDWDEVAGWLELTEDHPENAVWAFANNGCGGPDDFADAFAGEWDSLGHWAEEINEGAFTIPDALVHYIDWDGMGRDAELNGDIWTADAPGGGVFVFWNH